MKKVNLRRTITGFAAAAAMAFTAIAPTAINVSPIAPTAISASAATINSLTKDSTFTATSRATQTGTTALSAEYSHISIQRADISQQ